MLHKLIPLLTVAVIASAGHAYSRIFEVGPGMNYERISDVPLDALNPGDTVKIQYREEPYREKIIIRRSGTEESPIVIQGVPEGGKLPIIDGSNAVQIQKEKWPQSGRWLIKIGDGAPASHVIVRNLHLRNANNTQVFCEKTGVHPYADNAAGIFVRISKDVLIDNCIVHSCCNGIQTSYGPDVSNVTLNRCWIFDNGDHLNPLKMEHNVYLCGTNTVVQFCRFGEPHSDGNNLKDRGLDTVIRYNWIEGGKNRQLDLVDYKGYRNADAYVYGNVIIQGDIVHNTNMIHWGGDLGFSRSGTLFLFNNTIIAKHEQALFLVIRYPDCGIEMKNNVFVGTGNLCDRTVNLRGSHNWFSSSIQGSLSVFGWRGMVPGFCTFRGIIYMPCPASSIIDSGTLNIPKSLDYMPSPFGGKFQRPRDSKIDIGAYELPSRR